MEVEMVIDSGAYSPTKAHIQDAAYDLYAMENKLILRIGTTIDTGVHIAIPDGCVGMVVGRSGLNFKHSIFVPDGTIDPGYTGSIKVRAYAMDRVREVRRGDRIAQLLIMPVKSVQLVVVDSLPESARGSDGFGSTGR